jgi:hypothetical protein
VEGIEVSKCIQSRSTSTLEELAVDTMSKRASQDISDRLKQTQRVGRDDDLLLIRTFEPGLNTSLAGAFEHPNTDSVETSLEKCSALFESHAVQSVVIHHETFVHPETRSVIRVGVECPLTILGDDDLGVE